MAVPRSSGWLGRANFVRVARLDDHGNPTGRTTLVASAEIHWYEVADDVADLGVSFRRLTSQFEFAIPLSKELAGLVGGARFALRYRRRQRYQRRIPKTNARRRNKHGRTGVKRPR